MAHSYSPATSAGATFFFAMVCDACDNGLMATWLKRVTSSEPGFEGDLVERYTQRLIQLARRKLPERLRRRVDPEDLVQSVYRSFFRRLNDGAFLLEESHDIWRVLAAITFHKTCRAVRFHQQERRDVRREASMPGNLDGSRNEPVSAEPSPGPEDIATLFDSLEQLLQRLPERQRQIIVLRLEGWSIEDIAKKVERSESTVLRALARVRDVAAAQLEVAT
jgi:RNA polymerase sigma factor (sigma-70 family)